MLKYTITIVLISINILVFSQNGSTFKVRKKTVDTIDTIKCIPAASIAGKTRGTITTTTLLDQGCIDLNLSNCDSSYSNYTISSFTFSSIIKRDLCEIRARGNCINTNMIRLIKTLPYHSKVYFEEITARNPNGIEIKIPAIILKIDNRVKIHIPPQ